MPDETGRTEGVTQWHPTLRKVRDMRENGHTVRYVGEVHSPNYATHTRSLLSMRHAVETLRDLYLGTESDEILLFPVDPHESVGEAFGRVESIDLASHIVKHGPRGGISVERV